MVLSSVRLGLIGLTLGVGGFACGMLLNLSHGSNDGDTELVVFAAAAAATAYLLMRYEDDLLTRRERRER